MQNGPFTVVSYYRVVIPWGECDAWSHAHQLRDDNMGRQLQSYPL